jgi:hypothetical protein
MARQKPETGQGTICKARKDTQVWLSNSAVDRTVLELGKVSTDWW